MPVGKISRAVRAQVYSHGSVRRSDQSDRHARSALAVLREAIDLLIDIDGEMPISRVKVLLALFEEDGISNQDISERVFFDSSKISRDVSALEKNKRYGGRGYELVCNEKDLANRRRTVRWLTPKGKSLRKRLVSALTRLAP